MVADFNQVWVLDWGLALVDGESAYNTRDGASTVSGPEDDIRALTHSGEILGTPAYMAPEQATGASAAIGPAADIYSVGSILHEVLSGRPAFAGRGQDEVIAMKRAREVPPLRSEGFPIPAPLVSIVRRAMMKEPQDRYADAGALADDLCHWMDGLPVLAHRESRFEQAARLMRRYRVPIALVVCYLVVRTGLFVLLRR